MECELLVFLSEGLFGCFLYPDSTDMSALLLMILGLFALYVGIGGGGGGGGGGGAGALLDTPFLLDFLVFTSNVVTMGACGRVGLNLGGGGGRFLVIFFKSAKSSLVIVELDVQLESLSFPGYRFFLDFFILLATTAMESWNEDEDELLQLPM